MPKPIGQNWYAFSKPQATEKDNFTTVPVKGLGDGNSTPVHALLDKGPYLGNAANDRCVLASHVVAAVGVVLLDKVLDHAVHGSLGKAGVSSKEKEERNTIVIMYQRKITSPLSKWYDGSYGAPFRH